MFDATTGSTLPALARAAIAESLGLPHAAFQPVTALNKAGASFVTLTRNGQLRGCIGSLQASRPLAEDIRHNAVAAALHDPRFPPLAAEELASTHIEVSLLSAPQPMTFSSEADALAQLRPGVDGVILEYGLHHATFLPQVWEQLPTAPIFMAHLKSKAGLPADFWSDRIHLSRYTVQKWHEAD